MLRQRVPQPKMAISIRPCLETVSAEAVDCHNTTNEFSILIERPERDSLLDMDILGLGAIISWGVKNEEAVFLLWFWNGCHSPVTVFTIKMRFLNLGRRYCGWIVVKQELSLIHI